MGCRKLQLQDYFYLINHHEEDEVHEVYFIKNNHIKYRSTIFTTYDDDYQFNYTYNAENRLISAEEISSPPGRGRVRVDAVYDYMGRRTEKKSTPTTAQPGCLTNSKNSSTTASSRSQVFQFIIHHAAFSIHTLGSQPGKISHYG